MRGSEDATAAQPQDSRLRVLYLESNPNDVTLLLACLEGDGFDCEISQAANRTELIEELSSKRFDIILSDFPIPGFDSFTGLDIARVMAPETPFIFLSGSSGDEFTTESLKRGATDHLHKYRLSRVPVAVRRALGETRERRSRLEAERALRESEFRFRALIEHNWDAVVLLDTDGRVIYGSPSVKRILKTDPEGLFGRSYRDILYSEDARHVRSLIDDPQAQGGRGLLDEFRVVRGDGSLCWVEGAINNLILDPSIHAIVVNFRDITERKEREFEREAIIRVSTALRTAATRTEMLPVLLDQVAYLVGCEGCAISFLDAASDSVFFELGRGGWDGIGGTLLAGLGREFRRLFENGPCRMRQDDSLGRKLPGSLFSLGEVVGVPLVAQGEMFGAVWVGRKSKPTESDLRRLEAIADMAANAIQRATLLERSVSTANEFTALHETVRDLTEHRDLTTLLETIVDRASSLLHASRAAMFLHRHESDELEMTVAKGYAEAPTSRIAMGEGAIGQAAQRREPIAIDARLTPSLDEKARVGVQLAVPMLYSGELLGVLGVGEMSANEGRVTEADVRLLSLFAGQAAGIIHNTRLLEDATRRLQYVQALHMIDMAISSSVDLRIVLNILLGQAVTLLEVDASAVLLVNDRTQRVDHFVSRGFHTSLIDRASVRVGHGLPGKVVAERQAVSIPDLSKVSVDATCSLLVASEGFGSYAAAPIVSKGKVLGVLELFTRRPRERDSEWVDFLVALAGQAAIAIENIELFEGLQRSNAELTLAYDATIEGWSRALDLRDKETEGHTLRVTEGTERLARAMGLSENELVHIHRGALLHDIGKMGIPDSILLKAGPLTDEEWIAMRRHPVSAYEMLAPIAFLGPALDIPYCHHERWDGNGYPRGLKAEQIPLAARIFAVIDVWDALSTDRPYRKGWPKRKVLDYIRDLSSKAFDPNVVRVFIDLFEPDEPLR